MDIFRNKPVKIITLSFIGILVLMVSLYFLANSALFFPSHSATAFDRLNQLPHMEEVTIKSDDVTLSGWLVKNTDTSPAPLVIFFGGNGQNAASTVYAMERNQYWSVYHGFNFLMVDYPGYGLSSGRPSQESIFHMALAVYDYAISRVEVDLEGIILQGFSLGTGVATYVASKREVAGLILIAPYDDMLHVYNDQVNIFHGPLSLLIRNRFPSTYYASQISIEPLIISSRDDEIISYRLADNLVQSFPVPVENIILDGLKHNDLLGDSQVKELIHEYLEYVNRNVTDF